MAKQPPSVALRRQLREKIRERIEHLQLAPPEAAKRLGFSPAQLSRLRGDEDIFTLDRLIDAAVKIGLTVRTAVTRPYR